VITMVEAYRFAPYGSKDSADSAEGVASDLSKGELVIMISGVSREFEGWEEGVAHLVKEDPILRALVETYPGEKLAPKDRPFETLVRSVVGQQISVKAAESVWLRFVGRLGEVSPEAILDCSVDELRACGLSGRKVEYVKGIADDPARCDPAQLTSLDDEDACRHLVAYRGVGEWTAQMFMIFALCRPDILSLKDIGLRRGVEKHYADGRRLSDQEIQNIAEPWRPWRSIATWYLWRSLDPIPVEY